MNWTPQQKIRLGFWLLTLMPVVLGILAARNAYELADAARHVAVTNDIGKRLEKLFSEIKDVEVAQREYILLGGEKPIKTISETYSKLQQDIKELRTLGADPRWLNLLETLISQKVEETQRVIEQRNELGPEFASQSARRPDYYR